MNHSQINSPRYHTIDPITSNVLGTGVYDTVVDVQLFLAGFDPFNSSHHKTSATNMHLSKIYSVFIAMAGSVYSQDQIEPVTDLNDVRPGHIADMSALPYEIVSLLPYHTSNSP
jgi:hypothetical protein